MDTDATDAYSAEGFVSGVSLVSEANAAKARQELEHFIEQYDEHPDFADWCYFKSHIILPWIIELAVSPGVVDAATALLGPDVLLWNSFIPAKPPGSGGQFSWHQDATYWHMEPIDHMATIWVALGPVSPENGSMWFLPGSHQQRQLPHEMTTDPTSMLRRGQRVLTPVDESKAVPSTLKPGEASIHHPYTLHKSAPNPSQNWRLGVSPNFVSADIVALEGYAESALYICGEDRNTTFERDPMPESALSRNAMAALQHAKSLAATRYSDVT